LYKIQEAFPKNYKNPLSGPNYLRQQENKQKQKEVQKSKKWTPKKIVRVPVYQVSEKSKIGQPIVK
jgi:hypothetical protein